MTLLRGLLAQAAPLASPAPATTPAPSPLPVPTVAPTLTPGATEAAAALPALPTPAPGVTETLTEAATAAPGVGEPTGGIGGAIGDAISGTIGSLSGGVGGAMADLAVGGFEAVLQVIYTLTVDGMLWAFGIVVEWLLAETRPDLTLGAFIRAYEVTWAAASLLMGILFMVAIVDNLIAKRPDPVLGPFRLLFVAVLLTRLGLYALDLGMTLVDWVVLAFTDQALDGSKVAITALGSGFRQGLGGPLMLFGGFIAAIMGGLTIVAGALLKLREAAVMLVAVVAVFAYASLVWHRGRKWLFRLIAVLLGLAVSVIPMVLALTLASAMFAAAADPTDSGVALSAALTGVALLLLVVLAPLFTIGLFSVAGGQAMRSVAQRAHVRERVTRGVDRYREHRSAKSTVDNAATGTGSPSTPGAARWTTAGTAGGTGAAAGSTGAGAAGAGAGATTAAGAAAAPATGGVSLAAAAAAQTTAKAAQTGANTVRAGTEATTATAAESADPPNSGDASDARWTRDPSTGGYVASDTGQTTSEVRDSGRPPTVSRSAWDVPPAGRPPSEGWAVPHVDMPAGSEQPAPPPPQPTVHAAGPTAAGGSAPAYVGTARYAPGNDPTPAVAPPTPLVPVPHEATPAPRTVTRSPDPRSSR